MLDNVVRRLDPIQNLARFFRLFSDDLMDADAFASCKVLSVHRNKARIV